MTLAQSLGEGRMDRRELRAGAAVASARGLQLKPFNSSRTSMVLIRVGVVCLVCCYAAGAGSVAAQPAPGSGRLEGVVVRQDGSGVGGVLVLIEESGQRELTDAAGTYAFGRLAPATYTMVTTLGPHSMRQSEVVINTRTTTALRTVV